MIYTECRVCSGPLMVLDSSDGLCSNLGTWSGTGRCYFRFRTWWERKYKVAPPSSWLPYESPQAQVAIDEWLEKGAP